LNKYSSRSLPVPEIAVSDPTLEDIALKAGVSRSTVSRVINNQPNVRSDVRQRILDVIEQTGYHPNVAARALASQRSWTIGLVIPRTVSSFFSDPFFPRLTQGIAQACNQYNYTLGLFLVSNHQDEEKIFPRISRKGSLDGLLVQSGQIGDLLIDRLVHTGMPVVIAGRPFQPNDVSYIDVDNVRAAYDAVRHLIQLGRKRIATITGSLDSTVSIDRLAGYRQALAENGLLDDPPLIAEGDFTEMGGYTAMQSLLAARPDAVFVASDLMAIGTMRAIREAGLRVPEDISIVSFDDLPIATMAIPNLTTVRQPIYQFGYKSVELLLDLIDNGLTPPRRVILETELVVRDSCGAPHADPTGTRPLP
jgi:LacI family transcriptional regulator